MKFHTFYIFLTCRSKGAKIARYPINGPRTGLSKPVKRLNPAWPAHLLRPCRGKAHAHWVDQGIEPILTIKILKIAFKKNENDFLKKKHLTIIVWLAFYWVLKQVKACCQ